MGKRLSSVRRSTIAPGAGAISRTGTPRATTSSARPRASSSSSVRACTANALVMLGAVARRSSTRQRTPASASSQASVRPVGPAPMMRTSVFMVTPGSWDVVATTVRRAGVRSHPWVHRCLRRWHHPIGPRGREVPMAAFTEIEGDFLRITAGLGGGGPRGVRARPLACGLVHAAAVESLAGAGDAWSGVPGGPAHRVGVAPGGEQRRCSDVASVMSPVSGPTLARCSARSCTAGRRSARWSTA